MGVVCLSGPLILCRNFYIHKEVDMPKAKRGFARFSGERRDHSHNCDGQRGGKTAKELALHCERFGRLHLTAAEIDAATKRGLL